MFEQITPAVKRLLIVTFAVFLISNLMPDLFYRNFAFFNPYLPNNDISLNPLFRPWQPITYIFMHGGIGHIFGNMFALFIFGPALEIFMGSKKFMFYYLLTGIGAALLNSALNTYEMTRVVTDSFQYDQLVQSSMVGASGSVFGLLVAYGVLFPNVELMLLFIPFPIKAKYFVILYGLYELYAGATGFESGIAHFAHIGGLISGFILLKFFNFDKRSYY